MSKGDKLWYRVNVEMRRPDTDNKCPKNSAVRTSALKGRMLNFNEDHQLEPKRSRRKREANYGRIIKGVMRMEAVKWKNSAD